MYIFSYSLGFFLSIMKWEGFLSDAGAQISLLVIAKLGEMIMSYLSLKFVFGLFFSNFRHRQPCRSNPELASPPPTSSISSAQPVRGQDGGGTAHIAATYVLHSGAPRPAAVQLPALIQRRCGSTPTARTRALLHSKPPGELRTQSGPAGWPRTGRWSAL